MTRPVFTTPLEALRYHVTGKIERGESVAIVGIEERRQSTPHYRELVHQSAAWRVRCAGDNYDTAVERLEHAILLWPRLNDHQHNRDVLTLLRRRADTVKGMHNA